jgi:hypothetical protein
VNDRVGSPRHALIDIIDELIDIAAQGHDKIAVVVVVRVAVFIAYVSPRSARKDGR